MQIHQMDKRALRQKLAYKYEKLDYYSELLNKEKDKKQRYVYGQIVSNILLSIDTYRKALEFQAKQIDLPFLSQAA